MAGKARKSERVSPRLRKKLIFVGDWQKEHAPGLFSRL